MEALFARRVSRACNRPKFVAAERVYIDEVITPSATRKRLCRALNMLRTKEVEHTWKKHDNIPL